MPYVQTYKGLSLCSLTPEQHARTCNYWWTVTHGATAHTAFRTFHALSAWLQRCGLKLTQELPAQGVHSYQQLKGEYRTSMHMELSREQFDCMQGERFRALSNGQYTQGIACRDDNRIVTLHTMNPNCRDRAIFNYWESAALEDTGAARHCRACSAAIHPLHVQCPNCQNLPE